uniref:hypothetical protein n=1 Tax=Nitrosomonas sp. TaxID=42353 RepID=UPI0025F2B824
AQRMNIPDKKTDLEDNRNARSFLKTRIQTESAGFFNGLLNLGHIDTATVGLITLVGIITISVSHLYDPIFPSIV